MLGPLWQQDTTLVVGNVTFCVIIYAGARAYSTLPSFLRLQRVQKFDACPVQVSEEIVAATPCLM